MIAWLSSFLRTNMISVLAFSLISIVSAGLVWYNNVKASRLEAKVEKLLKENAVLEEDKKLYLKTIENIQKNITESNQRNIRLYRKYDASSKRITELEQKLSEHDIYSLAKSKPGLVANSLNSGIARVWDDFETATTKFYTRDPEKPPN